MSVNEAFRLVAESDWLKDLRLKRLSQELAVPGDMRQAQTYNFNSNNVEKQVEGHQRINVKLREKANIFWRTTRKSPPNHWEVAATQFEEQLPDLFVGRRVLGPIGANKLIGAWDDLSGERGYFNFFPYLCLLSQRQKPWGKKKPLREASVYENQKSLLFWARPDNGRTSDLEKFLDWFREQELYAPFVDYEGSLDALAQLNCDIVCADSSLGITNDENWASTVWKKQYPELPCSDYPHPPPFDRDLCTLGYVAQLHGKDPTPPPGYTMPNRPHYPPGWRHDEHAVPRSRSSSVATCEIVQSAAPSLDSYSLEIDTRLPAELIMVYDENLQYNAKENKSWFRLQLSASNPHVLRFLQDVNTQKLGWLCVVDPKVNLECRTAVVYAWMTLALALYSSGGVKHIKFVLLGRGVAIWPDPGTCWRVAHKMELSGLLSILLNNIPSAKTQWLSPVASMEDGKAALENSDLSLEDIVLLAEVGRPAKLFEEDWDRVTASLSDDSYYRAGFYVEKENRVLMDKGEIRCYISNGSISSMVHTLMYDRSEMVEVQAVTFHNVRPLRDLRPGVVDHGVPWSAEAADMFWVGGPTRQVDGEGYRQIEDFIRRVYGIAKKIELGVFKPSVGLTLAWIWTAQISNSFSPTYKDIWVQSTQADLLHSFWWRRESYAHSKMEALHP
ncbi:hypothetical protein BDZ89DRAFT_1050073 [Hymenopellis radicata]|nr:hypothetical protein BDZ89DRAFT_1050073 [Hymenopellis radicata]